MALPRNYVASDVNLTPEEHAGAAPLYEAIALAQEKLSDGIQLDDALALPVIGMKAAQTVRYIVDGAPDDTSDDHQIAKRMSAVGFALVRASKVLDDVGAPSE